MVNTLSKFLAVTNFDRDKKYPSKKTLNAAIKNNKISKELAVNIAAFFLYDNL